MAEDGHSPAAGALRRGLRRLAFAVLYAFYVAVFVAAFDYALFYRPFIADLLDNHPYELIAPDGVDPATMRRIGALRSDRSNSFTRFSTQKDSSVLRLCAVGDSFTFGDEVVDGHDYPARLQAALARRGVTNVEVLNFGNSWYGFHQAYLLWDGVGRNYACDFVLLGPDCFQPDRDTTFNHAGLGEPYYLHARYIVDGDDVRLVEVLGDSARERFEHYFAFLPSLRYLRYDRRAPAFLLAPLPQGRTLANPFYYDRGSAEVEAYRTYTVLLERLVADVPGVVLLHALPSMVDAAAAVPGLVAGLAPRDVAFPYGAIGGHLSGVGNDEVAARYLSALTGRPVPILGFEFADLHRAPESPADLADYRDPTALSEFSRVTVQMAGKEVGLFAGAGPLPSMRTGGPSDFSQGTTRALLALRPGGATLVHSAFVEIDELSRPGTMVALQLGSGDGARTIRLAPLRWMDPRAPLAVVDLDGAEFTAGRLLLDLGKVDDEAGRLHDGTPVFLAVGGRSFLAGAVRAGWVELLPNGPPLRHLRSAAGQFVDANEIAREGRVEVLFEGAGADLRVALASYALVDETIEPPDSDPPVRLQLKGGLASVVRR